ncbi:hypothetical protein ScPMuIL_017264 [Solemya velum]
MGFTTRDLPLDRTESLRKKTGIAVKSTMSIYIWVVFFISLLTERVFSQMPAGSPTPCFLDHSQTAENFSTEKLLGVWYARKINANTSLLVRPTMLEVYEGQGDLLHLRILLRSDGGCVVVQSIASPSCGAGIGEFYMTRPADVPTGDWIKLKVLYLADDVLATFECGKENPDGICDESGEKGVIWTREPNGPRRHCGGAKKFYRDLCLDMNDWERLPYNDCDEAILLDKPKYVDSRGPECQAMNIPAVPNHDYSQALGLWYGIAFVVTPPVTPPSFVAYDANGVWVGSVTVTMGGLGPGGQCVQYQLKLVLIRIASLKLIKPWTVRVCFKSDYTFEDIICDTWPELTRDHRHDASIISRCLDQ